jgi:hypothetical protein
LKASETWLAAYHAGRFGATKATTQHPPSRCAFPLRKNTDDAAGRKQEIPRRKTGPKTSRTAHPMNRRPRARNTASKQAAKMGPKTFGSRKIHEKDKKFNNGLASLKYPD